MNRKLVFLCLILASYFLVGWVNKDGALVKAVKEGNTEEVQVLLKQGVNPNIRTGHSQTLLMVAARKGYLSIAKLLLENGADIAAVDHNGKTALLIARESLQVEMVKMLNSWKRVNPKLRSTPTPAEEENSAATSELTNAPDLTPTPMETAILSPTATPLPDQTLTPVPTPVIVTSSEIPSKITPTPEIAATPVQEKKVPLILIFFDFNRANLKSDEIEKLSSLLPALKNDPKLYVILGGHADEVGSAEDSFALSRGRVSMVKKYLLEAGIAENRIIGYAYGKEYPLKKGHDEASRAFNRRVDVLCSDTVLSTEEMLSKTIN